MYVKKLNYHHTKSILTIVATRAVMRFSAETDRWKSVPNSYAHYSENCPKSSYLAYTSRVSS